MVWPIRGHVGHDSIVPDTLKTCPTSSIRRTMSKHYFISDLHMFSRRSQSELHADDIWAAARDAQTFILGGDIFDFHWSTLDCHTTTIDAAIRWLEELVSAHPACEFHFVLGNHDYNRRFIDRLEQLVACQPNLACHHFYLRLGQSIFLHGDVADREMDQEMLVASRSRWLDDREYHALRHWLYDMVVHARLHKIAGSLAHPRRSVARKILCYLESIGEGPGTGLRHVYFGHTHTSMSNYEYSGLLFHNGGAPIKGLKFRIVEAEIAV